jgi:hypothetical protein
MKSKKKNQNRNCLLTTNSISSIVLVEATQPFWSGQWTQNHQNDFQIFDSSETSFAVWPSDCFGSSLFDD